MKSLQNEEFKSQLKIVKTNLILDVSTFIPVIIVAVMSNSLVLLTDVFDYVFTISSEVIFLLVLTRCAKNLTGNYNFGLGKMQSMSALFTSVVMMVGLLIILFEAFQRLFETEVLNYTFVVIGMIVHAIGFGVNFYLWQSAYKISKATQSPIMDAQWRVNRTNAFGNVGVLLSLILSFSFQEFSWSRFFDPFFAILLVGLTINSFVKLFKNSMNDLLDKSIDEELQLKVLKALADYEEGYERFYDFHTRKSGSKIFIDIVLGFDPVRKVGDALDIASRIKEKLEYDIKGSTVNVILHSLEEFEETLLNIGEGDIVPMAKEHLEQCKEIYRRIWGEDEYMNKCEKEFLASIEPNLYAQDLNNLGSSHPRYWVVKSEDKVVGFSGFVFRNDDEESVWGGFMGQDPEVGRKGTRLMILLMWKVLFEARQTGRKYFRVYTSTFEAEKAVNLLYENTGLRIYKVEKGEEYDILYRQAELEELYEKNRPGKKRYYRRNKI